MEVLPVGLPAVAHSFSALAAESTWLFAGCHLRGFGPVLTVAPKGGLGSASCLHWHPGGTRSSREGARAGRRRREGQDVRWHGLSRQLLLQTRTAAERGRRGAQAASQLNPPSSGSVLTRITQVRRGWAPPSSTEDESKVQTG